MAEEGEIDSCPTIGGTQNIAGSRRSADIRRVTTTLPKICYVGPALEASLGGSAILYKLLQSYPPDRLMAIELGGGEGPSVERLPGVKAVRAPALPAWIGPRGHTIYDLTFLFARLAWASWFSQKIGDFQPEAIVCVIHGWQCEAALVMSQRRRIPFHALLHDHANNSLSVPRFLRKLRLKRWKRVCQFAASRTCVSPFMAEEIQNLTGHSCNVLYPGLAPNAELANGAIECRRSSNGPLVFAFIGRITSGYDDLLRRLGRIVSAEGDQLVVHTPQASSLLQHPETRGIVDGGWISGDIVSKSLRQEADVVFLPMSFHPDDRSNTCISFPSKLAEYCSAGLPVLIWGPTYCSAVRWAREHPGFAEVVDTESEEEIRRAVRRLKDPTRREQFGKRSLALAIQYFSHEKTFAKFMEIVQKNGSPTAAKTGHHVASAER